MDFTLARGIHATHLALPSNNGLGLRTSMFRQRQTDALRKGRTSEPFARYFVTWCVASRRPVLASSILQRAFRNETAALEAAKDIILLACCVMPDHVHLLLELGGRLSLSQVVGRLKSCIRQVQPGILWQENFFDHRIRSSTGEEDFALYIFMNPYRAGCCTLRQTWQGWIPPRAFHWSFQDKLRPGGLPQPEWLERTEGFARTLPAGAE